MHSLACHVLQIFDEKLAFATNAAPKIDDKV